MSIDGRLRATKRSRVEGNKAASTHSHTCSRNNRKRGRGDENNTDTDDSDDSNDGNDDDHGNSGDGATTKLSPARPTRYKRACTEGKKYTPLNRNVEGRQLATALERE